MHELLAFLERRQRIAQLAEVGSLLRPDIPWPNVTAAVPGVEQALAEPMLARQLEKRAALLSDLYGRVVDLSDDWQSQDLSWR